MHRMTHARRPRCALTAPAWVAFAFVFVLPQVSVVVKSDAPEDTGRRLLSAWNDPSSRLHAGTITSLIDFSQVNIIVNSVQQTAVFAGYFKAALLPGTGTGTYYCGCCCRYAGLEAMHGRMEGGRVAGAPGCVGATGWRSLWLCCLPCAPLPIVGLWMSGFACWFGCL